MSGSIRYLLISAILMVGATRMTAAVDRIERAAEWRLVSIRHALDGGSPVFEMKSQLGEIKYIIAHARVFEPYKDKNQVVTVVAGDLASGSSEVIEPKSMKEQKLIQELSRVLMTVADDETDVERNRLRINYVAQLIHLIIQREAPWPW